jgi:NADP-dependent 3-hydroxy acid dehydrogenase YdfG
MPAPAHPRHVEKFNPTDTVEVPFMNTIAVIGAGPQLGRAIGQRFAAEGFNVALVARDRTRLEAVADRIRAEGTRVEVFPADVTDRPGLQAALAAAAEQLGPIDVLEYSPAPTPSDLTAAPIVDAAHVTVDALLPHLDTYLLGGVAAVNQVLPGMLERGSGTILVTSGAGSGPIIVPQVANVQIATAGMRNWILNLNAALSGTGVYAAHVAIAAYIGQGGPASEPEAIAEAYWRLHGERAEAELFYDDLPDGFQGLADKFQDS